MENVLKPMQGNHRALLWLAECLLELPMNIFTDDEKRSIVKKIIKIGSQFNQEVCGPVQGKDPVVFDNQGN